MTISHSLAFALCVFPFMALCQNASFHKSPIISVPKFKTIHFGSIVDVYEPQWQTREAPEVGGDAHARHLKGIKEHIRWAYPEQSGAAALLRGTAEPPVILQSFFGNNATTGIPCDNHIAVNDDRQIISVINSHLAVMDPGGSTIKSFGFLAFTSELGLATNVFDPRVYFDPEFGRFVLVFLAGSSSEATDIVVAFSQSSDATGEWYIYTLPGNPEMGLTWTDYPMITLTSTDLFISGNLIRDDVSWQEGFEKTILWQIDKNEGYNGNALDMRLWSDITFEGQYIRNLCPVRYGDELWTDGPYFLSNKNFAVESDSIFLLRVTGNIHDTTAVIQAELLFADSMYGVPPDARQTLGLLATNDARILDAFLINDQIQFVANSRHPETNTAGICHGIITNVSTTKEVELNHVIGPDGLELGYPAISYVGQNDIDADAIISVNHTSTIRFPGVSALYYHPVDGYSDLVTIKEGDGHISMISGVQRWGDYSGSQRVYSEGQRVWISGFHGVATNRNFAWVASLATPGFTSSTKDNAPQLDAARVIPNPVGDHFTIELTTRQIHEEICIELYDARGRKLTELIRRRSVPIGNHIFSFNAAPLENGTYFIRFTDRGDLIAIETIIRQ